LGMISTCLALTEALLPVRITNTNDAWTFLERKQPWVQVRRACDVWKVQ
jgi:hypothetical protein